MKLESVNSSPFLKEYAAGARVRATKPIQPILAPTVTVGTLTGHYKNYTRDSRLTLPSVKRALNGKATLLQIANDDTTFACSVSAIDAPIEACLGEDLLWAVPDALDLLAEVEEQILEWETITTAIAAAGAGSAMTWDANSDPVKLIDEKLLLLAKAARSDGLGVAFGAQAWHVFKNHAKVQARGGASISWESHPNLFHAGARYAACYSLYDTGRARSASAILLPLGAAPRSHARIARNPRAAPVPETRGRCGASAGHKASADAPCQHFSEMKKDLLIEFADGRSILIPCPSDETIGKIARLDAAANSHGPETAGAFIARITAVVTLLVSTARWTARPAEMSEAVTPAELTMGEARQIVNACIAQAHGRDPKEHVKAGEASATLRDFPALNNLPLWQLAALVEKEA